MKKKSLFFLRNFMFVLVMGMGLCKPIETGAVSFFGPEIEAESEVKNENDEEDVADEEEIEIEEIDFADKKLTLGIGNSYKLAPVLTPEDATNQTLKWKSSKKKVATVSKDGTIKAKKNGTTTITCYAQDGSGVKAKCKITVKKLKFSERTKRPGKNSKHYYSIQNIYYRYNQYAPTGEAYAESKYCAGNCTWYACGRASEILTKAKKKMDLGIFGGNPYAIWNKNLLTKTYTYGKTPKVGALVVFGKQYGNYHIAVVEKIVNGVVYVSESGYKTVTSKPHASNVVFHYGSIDEWNKNREIIGYIYLI